MPIAKDQPAIETPTDLPTGRGVQSVEVAGRILSVLADSTKPMMLRDIADAAGLPPGQAHPYIVSFRKIGLVEQDVASGLYRLGWFALHLGLARLRGFDPYQLASESIAGLAQSLDLGVAISVWGTYGPTVIRSIESPHNVTTNSKPGTVLGLTGTATGKVWAAYLPNQLAAKRIAAELKASGVTARELETELTGIRAAGYAWTDGNPWPGIAAACAPVFDYTGQIQLAVALLGPSSALDCSAGSPQVTALLGFTRGLSAQLGYREESGD
ncbi:MAG TPA: IclR family transcriptional regulator [Alphaproteobacteria bacterium]|nr:IclR family transcriptional regulator [Alphaproteobacteria bacterium]